MRRGGSKPPVRIGADLSCFAMPELRPMREDDVEAVNDRAITAFEDLDRRRQEPVAPRMEPDAAYVRYRRVLATDPDGCWVADGDDGAFAGAALAILRDRRWGLSLLAVRPGLQSGGLGSALLNRALAYGDGARGGIILSSSDPRALRAYARDRLAHRRSAVGDRRRGRRAARAAADRRAVPARRDRLVPAVPAQRRVPVGLLSLTVRRKRRS
jgi:GNAT superfamily N-acetyltransferase